MTGHTDKALEKELLGLERQYWQAIKDGDIDKMASLSGDPCIVAGAQGVGSLDHASMKKMATTGGWKLDNFELSKAIVQSVGPDVAIVAYQVLENLTVEGQPVTLEAADLSTWVRHDGKWTCAAHTESAMGDPFGRDRVPQKRK